MIVASNTSPIINLAMVDQLDLLSKLYGKIIIPQAVYDEIVIEGAGQAGAKVVVQAEWFEVRSVTNRSLVTALMGELDSGEAEAVVLAVESASDLLLIDERKGRIAAHRLGLNYIGLLGVLLQAKSQGLLSLVQPVIEQLRHKAGFWVSETLYQHILQIANESE